MSAVVRHRSPMRRRSNSPRRRHPSPSKRSSPRRERLPDRHRTSTRTRSPVRNTTSQLERSPTKEKFPSRTWSPKDVRARSPQEEKLLARPRSPEKRRSRSPSKDKVLHRIRSPARARSRSPVRADDSRSPSPRTKRLRRAQESKVSEKLVDSERARQKHRECGEDRDVYTEKKSMRDRDDGRSSRSARHDRSVSPMERNHQRRNSSTSPSRSSRAGARDEANRDRGAERHRDNDEDSIAKMKAAEEALETKQKQQPSFELSGKLAEETNRVRGVTLLFNEPPDAKKPDIRWRLYVFKGGEVLNEPLYIHRQSCYLFGRERRVADVPTDHPSCSKQHAVIQYRLVEKEQPDGLMKKQVRPYLMDLGSTNGTFINENRVEPQRYYELFEGDTIKFGNSSREYVLLHENSVQ